MILLQLTKVVYNLKDITHKGFQKISDTLSKWSGGVNDIDKSCILQA